RRLVGVRVEQRGADALVSFQLTSGTTAHVKQNFNRLDVILSAQDPQGQPTPTPAPQQNGGANVETKNIDKSSPPSAAKDSVEAPPDKSAATPPASDTPTGTTVNTPAPSAPVAAGVKGRPVLSPEKANPVRIPRFETAPVIDGKLDDAVWKTAAVFKDFYQIQPGDNIAPSKPTDAYIGYDAHYLYFAFHCYDDPTKVRATIAKRDNVFGEDNVRVLLDTFNDQRRAYVLGWNPLGVQADGIMTEGSGTDFSIDIVMESKGVITSDGWTLEVAIPFKSLRYEAGKGKLWGIQVWRNIDRFNDEIDSWMPNSRDISSLLSQEGHMTGLEGISTEH